MNKDRMNAAKEVYRENKISREGERAGKQLLCPLDGLSIVSNERTANDPFPSPTSFHFRVPSCPTFIRPRFRSEQTYSLFYAKWGELKDTSFFLSNPSYLTFLFYFSTPRNNTVDIFLVQCPSIPQLIVTLQPLKPECWFGWAVSEIVSAWSVSRLGSPSISP